MTDGFAAIISVRLRTFRRRIITLSISTLAVRLSVVIGKL